MTDGDRPVVLVVDDEERVVEAYELWLGVEYEVRTANDGQEALDALDQTVDVVLLDRQMPGLNGDEVLERVRERGVDCRVAMVTGIDPDFDVVEMAFDDYLMKPVTGEDVTAVVERLLGVAMFDEQSRRYFALSKKKGALEAEKSSDGLSQSEAYATLRADLELLEERLDDSIAALEGDGFETAFASLSTDADAGNGDQVGEPAGESDGDREPEEP